jgi:predicted oxidoreductase (fatty acid repression mutant protein)
MYTHSHQCTAIMPFGEIVEHPAEKPKLPIEERLKVFN